MRKRPIVYYIGAFPEPYGGATIKNEIMYNELSKYFLVRKFDTSVLKDKMGVSSYLKLVLFFLINGRLPGVVSIASESLFRLSRLLFNLDRSILSRVSVFVIGGIMPDLLVQTNQDIDIYKSYRVIYVETQGMKNKLAKLGLSNVVVLPNCRKKPIERPYRESRASGLNCVFLSRVTKDKGVSLIIESLKLIHKKLDIKVDFWGPIEPAFTEEFLAAIDNDPRLVYKGVFDSINDDVYKLLSAYDILLFPTEHKGEGFPGILAEAKIAGVPVIASNINYNGEIVTDGIDGIILSNNSPSEIAHYLLMLNTDRGLLERLRRGSYSSADGYFIEDHIESIRDTVGGLADVDQ